MQSNELDQQLRDRALGESYTVKIRLGFLFTAVAALITVITIFISLRADVVALLKTVSDQQLIITQVQSANIDMRIQIQSIGDNLAYLKATIEADHRYLLRNQKAY